MENLIFQMSFDIFHLPFKKAEPVDSALRLPSAFCSFPTA